MSTFDAKQTRDLVLAVSALNICGRQGECEVFRVALQNIGVNGVDHLQSAIGRVVTLDIFGRDVDREENGADPTLFEARDIGMVLRRITNVSTVHSKARYVVVSVNQDRRLGDRPHLFVDSV